MIRLMGQLVGGWVFDLTEKTLKRFVLTKRGWLVIYLPVTSRPIERLIDPCILAIKVCKNIFARLIVVKGAGGGGLREGI